jgi:hypothetical protein
MSSNMATVREVSTATHTCTPHLLTRTFLLASARTPQAAEAMASRFLAALKHPNIGGISGFEESGDTLAEAQSVIEFWTRTATCRLTRAGSVANPRRG